MADEPDQSEEPEEPSQRTQIPQVIQMRRSLTDLIAHADELADAFENHDPTDQDFGAPLPPLMAVKLAAFRRAAAGEGTRRSHPHRPRGPPVLARTRPSHRHQRRSRPATLRSLLTRQQASAGQWIRLIAELQSDIMSVIGVMGIGAQSCTRCGSCPVFAGNGAHIAHGARLRPRCDTTTSCGTSRSPFDARPCRGAGRNGCRRDPEHAS